MGKTNKLHKYMNESCVHEYKLPHDFGVTFLEEKESINYVSMLETLMKSHKDKVNTQSDKL